MLNKGDPCYVRLESGEIVKAAYEYNLIAGRHHFVIVPSKNDESFIAIGTRRSPVARHECRFVCMSGMRKEYVDSINN